MDVPNPTVWNGFQAYFYIVIKHNIKYYIKDGFCVIVELVIIRNKVGDELVQFMCYLVLKSCVVTRHCMEIRQRSQGPHFDIAP